MALHQAISRRGSTADAARAAGIRGADEPLTLSEVDKRRTQLWTVSVFMVIGLMAVVALYLAGRDSLPPSLRFESFNSYILAILVGGLCLSLLVYVIDKEVRLRRLARLLVEERVLSAALSNRLTEISTLSEVGKAINTTLDLSDVLQLILTSALELLGGSEGSIMLMEEDGEHLKVVSYQGPDAERVMQGRAKVGIGIAGTVAKQRRPMLIDDDRVVASLGSDPRPERGIRSAMSVPLVRNDDLLGVLNLNETAGLRTFGENELNALGLFADHAAIAIGNASLFEKERETVERLEELDQLKSDFVASVSHELKTPLTAIIGAAKTINRKGDTMEPRQKLTFLDMIERQASKLLRLVEDVLTTSQIESGRQMKRELIDLKSAATQVVEELQQLSLGRRIEIVTIPERPQVWGDLIAIQQVLTNLVENALKYSDASARVTVRLVENTEEALIEVADTGPGIDKESLEVIFDRFAQVDSSSTRRVGGFGLGLFIVKNLVDAHGGTIEVESKLGVGTTFRIHLPKRSSDRGRLNEASAS